MAQLHSRYINGALCYWEGHRMRLIDAIGPNVKKFILEPSHAGQHAGGTGSDPPRFATTVVEAGAGTSEAEASDEVDIAWELITAANENDGISLQLFGETFRANSTRHISFTCKLEADEATQIDFLLGLAITDTALLGAVTDAIYFEKLDAATGISSVTEKNSSETQTDSLATFAADTAVTLDFYFDGDASTVYFFVDAALVATHTANIPDDEALRLSLELLAGSAAARRMKIHDLRVIQIS